MTNLDKKQNLTNRVLELKNSNRIESNLENENSTRLDDQSIIFFSININIFNKKFENFVKDETKIERFSNITKYSLNDFSMSANEIKDISAYYENDVNKIKACF